MARESSMLKLTTETISLTRGMARESYISRDRINSSSNQGEGYIKANQNRSSPYHPSSYGQTKENPLCESIFPLCRFCCR
jgi:hypothetical protein